MDHLVEVWTLIPNMLISICKLAELLNGEWRVKEGVRDRDTKSHPCFGPGLGDKGTVAVTMIPSVLQSSCYEYWMGQTTLQLYPTFLRSVSVILKQAWVERRFYLVPSSIVNFCSTARENKRKMCLSWFITTLGWDLITSKNEVAFLGLSFLVSIFSYVFINWLP